MLPFGHTIFDAAYDGLALGQKGGNYWISTENYYLESRLNESNRLFRIDNLDTPLTDKPEILLGLENRLKAYVQWFNNGLAKDDLYR